MSLPQINWPADGLIPVVVQDDESGSVLMMGFMNAEALMATQTTGEVHFWSRSRQQLWHKGGSSGHVQRLRSISINCDQNSLLIRVEQAGAVCHDGYATCYYRDVLEDGSLALNQDRLFDPRDVYGDGFGLQGLTTLWWNAYEYLKAHDLADVSGTSRLLRDDNTTVLPRIQDELAELAGVLNGSHVHTNQHDDAILEASQCCYWIVVAALKAGIDYGQIRPDRAIDIAEASVPAEIASAVLLGEAKVLSTISAGVVMHLLQVVAESVRTIGIDPRAVIEFDLNELRSRPYLDAFFAE